MQIRIVTADGASVHFCTEFGPARGTWRGESAPLPGEDYDVEIDAPETPLQWGTDINVSLDTCDSVGFSEQFSIIAAGRLESIDEDGYTVLRLGPAILVFFTAHVPAEAVGAMVTAHISEAALYPVF